MSRSAAFGCAALFAALALALAGCGSSDSGSAGEPVSLVINTTTGATFDLDAQSFVGCTSSAAGSAKTAIAFAASGSTMQRTSYGTPDCTGPVSGTEEGTYLGDARGDQPIVGWQSGWQPAHLNPSQTGTRLYATFSGGGASQEVKSTFLIDDRVSPVRLYTGIEDPEDPDYFGDADGYPRTMWGDFFTHGGLGGLWVATAEPSVTDLDGSGWEGSCRETSPGSATYEVVALSFADDQLGETRTGYGEDDTCATPTGSEAHTYDVRVMGDQEGVAWDAKTVTATRVVLNEAGATAKALLLVDDSGGAGAEVLYAARDPGSWPTALSVPGYGVQ